MVAFERLSFNLMKTILTPFLTFLLTASLMAKGKVISNTFTSSNFDKEVFDLNVYLLEVYEESTTTFELFLPELRNGIFFLVVKAKQKIAAEPFVRF